MAPAFYSQAVAMGPGKWLRSTDVLIAVGFVVAAAVEVVLRIRDSPVRLTIELSGSLILGSLAFRRARPLLTMTILAVGSSIGTLEEAWFAPARQGSTDVFIPIFAVLLAAYSLGAHGSARELLLGAFEPLALIVVVDLLQPGSNSLPEALLFFAVFVVGIPVLAGRLVRGRLIVVSRLKEQERQIRADGASRTEAVLALERVHTAERLQETLVAGMVALIAELAVAQQSTGVRQAESVSVIETKARALLAETRNAVVSLGSAKQNNELAGNQSRQAAPHLPQTREVQNAYLPWAALVAAAVCVGLLIEISATPVVRVPIPIALLGCFVIAAPIVFMWSRPLLMSAGLWTVTALYSALVSPLIATFTAISLPFLPSFAVAFFEDRRRALAGFGISVLGVLACFGAEALPGNVAFVLCAWIVGRVLRDRSRLAAELRLNNAMLAEQRDIALRRAVLDERARVGRELHDSIGHSLTVIALQAGAARRMWTSDRKKAEEALGTIGRAAAEGLAELRSGFRSREFDASTSLAEPSRVTDVTGLLEGARAAGLPISFHFEGEQPLLTPEADLAIFRVLQEALTNVLRHAPGAVADVTIRNSGSAIELVVSNTAADHPQAHSGGGAYGLRGMQDRVEARGGRLEWGRRADGGFEVRASLPAENVSV